MTDVEQTDPGLEKGPIPPRRSLRLKQFASESAINQEAQIGILGQVHANREARRTSSAEVAETNSTSATKVCPKTSSKASTTKHRLVYQRSTTRAGKDSSNSERKPRKRHFWKDYGKAIHPLDHDGHRQRMLAAKQTREGVSPAAFFDTPGNGY